MDKNYRITESKIDIDIAKEAMQEAKRSWIPNINSYVNNYYNLYSHNHDIDEFNFHIDENSDINSPHEHAAHYKKIYSEYANEIGIESSILIFNFNSQKLRNQKSYFEYLSSVDNFNDIKNKQIINVSNKYFDILLNMELLKIAESNSKNIGELLKITERKFEIGVITKFELFQVKQEFNSSIFEIAEKKINLEKSKYSLINFLQLDYKNNDIVIPYFESQNIEEISKFLLYDANTINAFLSEHPNIKFSKNRLYALQEQTKLLQNNLKPKLSGVYSIGTNFTKSFNRGLTSEPISTQWSNNIISKVGLTLSIPIMNRYADKSAIIQSKLFEKKSINSIQIEQNELYTFITNEILTFNSTIELINISEQKVKMSEEVYNMSLKSYNAGVISIYDLNKSRNDNIIDEINSIQLKLSNILRKNIINIYLTKNEELPY